MEQNMIAKNKPKLLQRMRAARRRRKILRIEEKCAALQAELEYWDDLRGVTTKGLPSWRHQEIGRDRGRLAALTIKKERLEAESRCAYPDGVCNADLSDISTEK